MDPFIASLWDLVSRDGAWLAAGIGSAGLGALGWRWPKLSGTTLVAPWVWSLVALVSLAATEIVIAMAASPAPEWAAPLRFAAAVSTVCPAMALLGAKRPQNRGWQLVVLSLWAILSLPSIEWLLFGGPREIHPARFWFLVVLVGASALNGLGTRFWLSSLLFCAGQLALLAPFLFVQTALLGLGAPLWGMAALVLAWLLIAAELPRSEPAALPLDRVWLDFRDALGVVWALRIMERVNASARMYDWPVTLTWSGFRPCNSDETAAMPAAVEENLRTLLRRFVSPAWIDARLGKSPLDSTVRLTISTG
jgi:hypothetical protein